MEKTVKIGEKEVKFKTSAALPKLYRALIKRDLFKDIARLQNPDITDDMTPEQIEAQEAKNYEALDVFTDIAYVMARHADPKVPKDPIDWLTQFETFDVLNIVPELMDLWTQETQEMSKPKKE